MRPSTRGCRIRTIGSVATLNTSTPPHSSTIAPGSPLKPENLLWVAQGKGSVKILGSSTFVGTVLGAERTIKIGQNVHIQGALLGNKVTIKGSSTLNHRPFTALF